MKCPIAPIEVYFESSNPPVVTTRRRRMRNCIKEKCALWMRRPPGARNDPEDVGCCAHVRQVEVIAGLSALVEHLPDRVRLAALAESRDQKGEDQ